ncbi:Rha family transcriptional regulator [Burkholderia glumae]
MDLTDFVSLDGDRPVTDSRKVAKQFGKQHGKVLRDIRVIVKQCGDEFAQANFGFSHEINMLANGRRDPVCSMTKDGFMLLAMGFGGAKAMAVKVAFIKAFNAMAEALRTGLWQRRQEAQAAFDAGRAQASIDGSGLSRWRHQKHQHERLIDELDRQMDLPLQLT